MSAPVAAPLDPQLKLQPAAAPVPPVVPQPDSAAPRAAARRGLLDLAYWVTLLLVAGAGLALRILPTATVKGVGFDEILYRAYVTVMDVNGLPNYDHATEAYLKDQSRPDAGAELPPTRFLYIFSSYLWKAAFHSGEPVANLRAEGGMWRDPALRSLRAIAKLFSVLTLALAGVWAWRLAGRGTSLGVVALLAFSPLQVHLSQHAMIDGFFTFWAMLTLWGLWEALRRPDQRRWLAAYGAGLAGMVLTKENSFFVFVAVAGLLVANRWARWGTVSRPLLLTTLLAPSGAMLFLVLVAGGFTNFFNIYRCLVSNAQRLTYAIATGDGPWQRYLVDLIVVLPLVLCLALGTALRGWKEDRWVAYLLGFVVLSYALMCNVRYGMNLRYAAIWELPLCLLAFAQLRHFAQATGRWAPYALPLFVGLVCLHEWHQYQVFFVQAGLYELAPADLLNAVKILK